MDFLIFYRVVIRVLVGRVFSRVSICYKTFAFSSYLNNLIRNLSQDRCYKLTGANAPVLTMALSRSIKWNRQILRERRVLKYKVLNRLNW